MIYEVNKTLDYDFGLINSFESFCLHYINTIDQIAYDFIGTSRWDVSTYSTFYRWLLDKDRFYNSEAENIIQALLQLSLSFCKMLKENVSINLKIRIGFCYNDLIHNTLLDKLIEEICKLTPIDIRYELYDFYGNYDKLIESFGSIE